MTEIYDGNLLRNLTTTIEGGEKIKKIRHHGK